MFGGLVFGDLPAEMPLRPLIVRVLIYGAIFSALPGAVFVIVARNSPKAAS